MIAFVNRVVNMLINMLINLLISMLTSTDRVFFLFCFVFLTCVFAASLDVLVWSNERVVSWVQAIGLKEYSGNLCESGVHGALLALDDAFDHNALALLLQIPTQNTQVPMHAHTHTTTTRTHTGASLSTLFCLCQARATLEREYNSLLAIATDRRVEEVTHRSHTQHTDQSPHPTPTPRLHLLHPALLMQDDDKNFRRAPSWRKKFRPKDVRGGSLGASDTLPANFRVSGSGGAASPSTQPKRSPMDGELCVYVCVCRSQCVYVCVRAMAAS